MKIEEAIETGTLLTRHGGWLGNPENVKAIKLLIEAGKRIKWHKEQHLTGYYEPLPGETEE